MKFQLLFLAILLAVSSNVYSNGNASLKKLIKSDATILLHTNWRSSESYPKERRKWKNQSRMVYGVKCFKRSGKKCLSFQLFLADQNRKNKKRVYNLNFLAEKFERKELKKMISNLSNSRKIMKQVGVMEDYKAGFNITLQAIAHLSYAAYFVIPFSGLADIITSPFQALGYATLKLKQVIAISRVKNRLKRFSNGKRWSRSKRGAGASFDLKDSITSALEMEAYPSVKL